MKYYRWLVCAFFFAAMSTGCADDTSPGNGGDGGNGTGGETEEEENNENDPDAGYDADLIQIRDACEEQCDVQHACDVENGVDGNDLESDPEFCKAACGIRMSGIQQTRNFAELGGGQNAADLRRCSEVHTAAWACNVKLGCDEEGCVEENDRADAECGDE